MNKKLRLILRFAKPHKGKFLILFSCITITTCIAALFPYLLGRLVDEVFYEKNMDRFLFITLSYGGLYLINQLLHFGLNMSWVNLWTKFLFDIRRAIFKKVLSMKGNELSSIYSGDIINRMNADTEEFMNFIHWNVFYNIGGLICLLSSTGFIFYLSWQLAIVTIILTPISVYTSSIFAKKLKKILKDLKEDKGILSSWLFEILKGMQDIKLLCAAGNVLSQYTGRLVKITRLQVKASKVEVVSERVNTGMSLVAQLALYLIAAVLIINGQFTIGGFTAVVSYFGTCVRTFRNLNTRINNIAGNMVSIERVMDVLEKESEVYNKHKKPFEITRGDITFNNVRFRYNNDIEILKGINLNITAGDVVSFVGYSGAGKTTLVNLIYKLYEVTDGAILIDGKDIDEFNLHNLREQIGIVHQDTYIYDASIRYNLIFADDNRSDDKLYNALEKAHLKEYIESLPEGLDTILGANDTALSGGQRQRLAIARIFLKNPKILIFDEATSSLDYESEMIIKESWTELCTGRTILVIAHRLSTIINSDKIAVLVKGKVKGYDSHANLINNNENYMKLFKEQYFDKREKAV